MTWPQATVKIVETLGLVVIIGLMWTGGDLLRWRRRK